MGKSLGPKPLDVVEVISEQEIIKDSENNIKIYLFIGY
jgi:hypothetical protein